MAFMTGLSTFMLILMVASLPFSRPSTDLGTSPNGFEAGTTMATQNKVTQVNEVKKMDIIVSNIGELVVVSDDEESARQVPTGPDPLHHNQNPTKP